ncbi:hypothetical protein ACFQ6N_32170 [Kitasatospora sp. NPDC056446]|uniref:hypothetical protein n=1 Tax=Kitasatospora sp. NPDC056446 TaxID=3345819 RepID=UPI0036D0EE9E
MGAGSCLTAAAVLAVAATASAVAVHKMTIGRLDHGTVFTQTSGDLAVKPGELFSIEVSAYRGAGGNWTLSTPAPDQAVAQAVGDEYVDNFGLQERDFAGTGQPPPAPRRRGAGGDLWRPAGTGRPPRSFGGAVGRRPRPRDPGGPFPRGLPLR